MYQLDPSCVTKWVPHPPMWKPVSANIWCPLCGEKGTFTLGHPGNFVPLDFGKENPRAWMALATCPSCDKNILVSAVNPGDYNFQDKMGCECLSIWPPPRIRREQIRGAEVLPDSVRAEYQEALNVYNARAWRAAVAVCRTTLESITRRLTGSDASGGTLAEDFEALAESGKLNEPLVKLATIVRKTGNAILHLDSRVEPTREVADTLLNLIEYLLEYAFTLPRLIDQVELSSSRLIVGDSPDSHS